MPRHRLTDEEWARVSPHLPAERGRRGRPARDNRLLLDAMLWRLAAGQPWRDLPPGFGPWQSVYTRFSRWRDAGVLSAVLRALQEEADARGEVGWDLHHVDSTVVRAQRSAALPKVIVPRAKGETGRPERPRVRRSPSFIPVSTRIEAAG